VRRGVPRPCSYLAPVGCDPYPCYTPLPCHAPCQVSRGVRYLLVGFVEVLGPDGSPVRSAMQRAAYEGEDAAGGRTDYERLADDWAAFVAAADTADTADTVPRVRVEGSTV
jgi:hypothetical protein